MNVKAGDKAVIISGALPETWVGIQVIVIGPYPTRRSAHEQYACERAWERFGASFIWEVELLEHTPAALEYDPPVCGGRPGTRAGGMDRYLRPIEPPQEENELRIAEKETT